MAIKHHKVVSALPPVLAADSVYYVRVGGGVDIYVTNGMGEVVGYRHNQGEARPWTGAADYNAMTVPGRWLITGAMANGPSQYPTPGAIVDVGVLDSGRIVQDVSIIYHNVKLYRMLITWDGPPFWGGWQNDVTVDAWTPITSLLNGWTPLAGFNSRYRVLGGSLQLQLYANIGTKTAGTSFWPIPFLHRPTADYPFQARGDLTSSVGQWAGNVAVVLASNGDAKLGPAAGSTTTKLALDVFLPLG